MVAETAKRVEADLQRQVGRCETAKPAIHDRVEGATEDCVDHAETN